jgi:hypothetical protein
VVVQADDQMRQFQYEGCTATAVVVWQVHVQSIPLSVCVCVCMCVCGACCRSYVAVVLSDAHTPPPPFHSAGLQLGCRDTRGTGAVGRLAHRRVVVVAAGAAAAA